MKKNIIKISAIIAILGSALVGCSSVSSDQFANLTKELNTTKTEVVNLKEKYDLLNEKLKKMGDTPQSIVNNFLTSKVYSLAGFNSGAYELTEDQLSLLKGIVQELNENSKDSVLEIVGYADTDGSAKYNLELGFRRAKAVSKAIEELGLDTSIIHKTSSLGYNKNVDSNMDRESKANNRRVEIYVR